jgi:hypothetical protein
VFWGVAVHEGREAANGEGNVGTCGHSKVVEGADEHAVRSMGLPVDDLGGDGDGFVRVSEYEASNHWHITRISVRQVEMTHDLVDKGSLGKGNGACHTRT